MNAETPDRRNSRLTSELPILSKFENHVTELKNMRCRNSRHMPELPTVRTPDSRRNSRPSRLWKTNRWPLVVHTGHVRYEYGYVRYDLDRELSKLFKLRVVGTPDHCRNFRPSELPMNQPENNTFTVTGQILDTSGMHTSGMARPATSQLALLSLKHSNLTWVGLSTYETLYINMMHLS